MKKTFVFGALVLISSFQIKAQQERKPNVLLIYTDDHRYTGVHSLGNQAVKTPYLDQLADDGISFTKAYLMGAFSAATCIPSRAMLHTGRDLFKLEGVGGNIPKDHTTIGEAFMSAGYNAHHVGKWHQDYNSLSRSFASGGKVAGKPLYLTDQYRMPYIEWNSKGKFNKEDCYLLEYDAQGKVVKRALTSNDKIGPTGTEKTGPHVSAVLADDAIEFIRDYKKKDPFFMYLAFPTPHDPRQAPKKYKDLYPEDEIELPPSYMSQHPFDNGHIVLRDEELAEWPRTEQIARQHLSDYYAIISHLDAQIGRVINTLKESGQYDNTIIVMAGDSGLGVGNHGLLGKQNIYDEDGVHVPLIISGNLIAKQNKGRRINALCYIHDIMPTICEMAGITTPKTVTGISLMPIINNKLEQIRDYTYHAYRQHQRAYRKGNYKLIEYVRAPDHAKQGEFLAGSRVTQLFNVGKDPWETFNLADFPEYGDILTSMKKEMKQVAVEISDQADGKRTRVNFWDFYE